MYIRASRKRKILRTLHAFNVLQIDDQRCIRSIKKRGKLQFVFLSRDILEAITRTFFEIQRAETRSRSIFLCIVRARVNYPETTRTLEIFFRKLKRTNLLALNR